MYTITVLRSAARHQTKNTQEVSEAISGQTVALEPGQTLWKVTKINLNEIEFQAEKTNKETGEQEEGGPPWSMPQPAESKLQSQPNQDDAHTCDHRKSKQIL